MTNAARSVLFTRGRCTLSTGGRYCKTIQYLPSKSFICRLLKGWLITRQQYALSLVLIAAAFPGVSRRVDHGNIGVQFLHDATPSASYYCHMPCPRRVSLPTCACRAVIRFFDTYKYHPFDYRTIQPVFPPSRLPDWT